MNIDVALAILLGDGVEAGLLKPLNLAGDLANASLPTPKSIVWVSSSVVLFLGGVLAGELVFMGEPGERLRSSSMGLVSTADSSSSGGPDFLTFPEAVRLSADGADFLCLTRRISAQSVRDEERINTRLGGLCLVLLLRCTPSYTAHRRICDR